MTAKNSKAKPARRTKATPPAQPNNAMKVHAKEGDNVATATAAAILAPEFRHAVTASQIHKPQFGSMEGTPGFGDYADVLDKVSERARKGDLAIASELLAAQALTLDNIFTEMARRMALNMGEYLGATETYARIAMKAQAQSRATLEALTKLHQPREQTVRHVHVNEGGQAVIADQFHHHAGGHQNGKAADQSHATGAAGIGPAMLGADPFGNGVPIPSREGEAAM
jgi:hypothetical protein